MIILNYLQNYFLNMEDIMATEVHLTQAVSPVSIVTTNPELVEVEGFAVHCGTFNDVTITKEELDKGAHTIIGAPIIKAHDMYGVPEEVTIGKVISAECKIDPQNGLYGLFYKAKLDAQEEELIRKMKLDLISATSIGFMSEHICSICGNNIWSSECDHWFWDEDFKILAKDINIHELSVVAVPADSNASINISFSKNDLQAFEKLEKQKLRRANMSDFKEKYNDIVDEFSQYKMDSADELNKLKEEFSKEKEELEKEAATKVAEVLELQNNVDTLTKENASLKEEVDKYKETFAKLEEDRLSELRAEVSALNKEVYGGLKEERIEQLSESALKEYHEVFSHQKEHMVVLSREQNTGNKYQENPIDEEAAPLEQLAARIGVKL